MECICLTALVCTSLCDYISTAIIYSYFLPCKEVYTCRYILSILTYAFVENNAEGGCSFLHARSIDTYNWLYVHPISLRYCGRIPNVFKP